MALQEMSKLQGVGIESLGVTRDEINQVLTAKGTTQYNDRIKKLYKKMQGGGIEAGFPVQESGPSGITARNISGEHIVIGNLGDKTIVPPAEPLNFVTTSEMGAGIAASLIANGKITKAAIISGMSQFTNAHYPTGQGAVAVITPSRMNLNEGTPGVGVKQ